jgi:hypothetical protein
MLDYILLGIFGLGFAAAVFDLIRESYRNEQDCRKFDRRDRDRWTF